MPDQDCVSIPADVAANNTNVSSLALFSQWYASVHGFASLLVCSFGIVTNVFNITVLTRKSMASQTNVILTWLAVSDLITMLSYIPFAWHFYCATSPAEFSPVKNSLVWMTFLLIHVSLSVVTHTVSIWLGVSLAVLRFVQLTSVKRGAHEVRRRIRIARAIVVSVVAVSVVATIPNFMINELDPIYLCEYPNATAYGIKQLSLGQPDVEAIVLGSVITYGAFAKLVPCVLMCVFGGALLYNVGVKGGNRRKRLTRMSSTSSSRRLSGHSRTTRMLITVLVLFLITELPQAFLIFLSVGLAGFYESIYQPLGDAMDILALLNNAINFVLYCSMSQQFREQFLEMYCKSHHTLKFTPNSFRSTIRQTSLDSQPDGFLTAPHNDRSQPLLANSNGAELTSNFPRTCTTELLSAIYEDRRASTLPLTVAL